MYICSSIAHSNPGRKDWSNCGGGHGDSERTTALPGLSLLINQWEYIVLSLYYNSAVIVKPVVGGESPKRFLSAATAHQQLKSFAGIDQIQSCDPAVSLGLPLLLRHSYGVKEKASIWKTDVLLAP